MAEPSYMDGFMRLPEEGGNEKAELKRRLLLVRQYELEVMITSYRSAAQASSAWAK